MEAFSCSVVERSQVLQELQIGTEDSHYCDRESPITQIDGDVRKGIILHIPQIHAQIEERGNNHASYVSEDVRGLIIDSQDRILRKLEDERPDTIFVEWYDTIDCVELEQIFSFFKKVFIVGSWDALSPVVQQKILWDFWSPTPEDLRKKLLFFFGGAMIYRWIHDDVRLLGADKMDLLLAAVARYHPVISWDKEDDLGIEESRNQRFIIDREREVLRRVQRYLQEHPWEKVVLIYGGLHDFSRQYYPVFWSFGPRLDRVNMPDITTRLSRTLVKTNFSSTHEFLLLSPKGIR